MAHRVHLDADELVNKANAIVNAEESCEEGESALDSGAEAGGAGSF